MPIGYLVTLGNSTLDAGDSIGGGQVDFVTDRTLGNGVWTWSGTAGGTTYTNRDEDGVYYLATDGNVYFVPDQGLVDTITSASVVSAPAYDANALPPDGTVNGTTGDDVIDDSYLDESNEGTTAGNDTIDAAAGNDRVEAGDGDDLIFGGDGNDVILGERGNDSIDGGAGNDSIYGAGGNDTIDAGANGDLVYGGSGDDSIDAGGGLDTVYGGSGADSIDGGGSSDTIYAGSGDDVIADTGGNGSADIIFGEAGNDSINAGQGNDTVSGGSGTDTIDGGAGDDRLIGNGDDDSILGGDGNDVLIGDSAAVATPSNESLNWSGFGAAGTDLNGNATQNTGSMAVNVEITNDGNATGTSVSDSTQYTETGEPFNATSALLLTGGAGPTATANITFTPNLNTGLSDEVENVEFRINDIDTAGWQDIVTVNAFDADGNPVTVTLTPASVTGTGNDDTVSGNTITAGSTSESAADAAGSVLVEIAGPVHEIEIIYSNAGTVDQALWITDVHFDTVADPDTDAGNDTLDGGAGNDFVDGNAGDDSIVGGDGDDTITGRDGDDTIGSFDNEAGNDSIFGGDGNDTLNGGAGDDEVYGGDGEDVLTGGAGTDTLDGGLGSDQFNITDDHQGDTIIGREDAGDTDVDTLGFFNFASTDGVTVTATGVEAGDYDFNGTDGTGTYSQIEAIEGTDFDDTFDMSADGSGVSVNTNDGDDSITGGDGDDVLSGDAGDDTLTGGDGADSLFGGDDADTIFGTSDDIIDGGEGGTDLDVLIVSDVASIVYDPVNGENGTVTFNDGSTLTFTNIEQVINEDASQDGTVSGTAGDDVIDVNYNGDPDGDLVDANDAVIAGDTGDDDLIEADAGDDSVTAGAGDDEVFGGSGDDTIDGGTGDDTLLGEADRDVFLVNDNFGTDTIVGGETGSDFDTLDLRGLSNPVSVVFTGPGAGTVTDTVTGDVITFSEIERLILTNQDDTVDATLDDGNTSVRGLGGDDSYIGSDDDDRVDGDNDADTLFGGAGEDRLDGDNGNDALFGGADNDDVEGDRGNDTLDGGTGNDTLDGGDGDDTILLNDNFADDGLPDADTIIGGEGDETNGDTLDGSSLTQNVTVNMTGDEEGTVTNGTGTTTFSEIEQIETGSGDDTFIGGAGADSISTNEGDDVLTVSDGDSVDAGAGDDVITLADTVGGPGATINITGGSGDESTGPDGGDTLRLGELANLQEVLDNATNDGTGSFSGSITLDDGTILNFSEIENIICFTPQTRIATPQGLRNIEDLKVGDMVVTRDHGLQPIRWIEARSVPAMGRFAPVRIRPNVLSGQERDLVVSPQHRVLFQGYRAELLFGESEVLVSAKHLVDGMDVTQDEGHTVTYIHMLFDQHEVIYAEGAATESFHPGDIGFTAVGDAAREELFAIFPELRADQTQYGNTARRCLKSHEAKLIRM